MLAIQAGHRFGIQIEKGYSHIQLMARSNVGLAAILNHPLKTVMRPTLTFGEFILKASHFYSVVSRKTVWMCKDPGVNQ